MGLIFGIGIQTAQTALALLENSHFESPFQRHHLNVGGGGNNKEKHGSSTKLIEMQCSHPHFRPPGSVLFSRHAFFSFGKSETEKMIPLSQLS